MVSLKWCCKQKEGIKLIEPNNNLAQGYLKKTGDSSKVVDKAESVAETKQGVVGIKVLILSPDAKIHDHIDVNEELIKEIEKNVLVEKDVVEEENPKKKKQKVNKKRVEASSSVANTKGVQKKPKKKKKKVNKEKKE